MLEPADPKAVVEAALFAAGGVLSLGDISEVVGLPPRKTRKLMEGLIGEYADRGGGMEILGFEDRYVMQVRADVAGDVSRVAPKELAAPLLRTLAVIAYNQPIAQSELAGYRGNKIYGHIKDLEEKGLIRSEKSGRTKILTTTKNFADYFGIEFDDPEFVRHAMTEETRLGVTPMYESLARRMGLEFVVVNPYKPYRDDLEKLKEIDLLVVAPGYAERVQEHYSRDLLEAGVRTFSQLKDSAEEIAGKAGRIDEKVKEELFAEIDELLDRYRERARGAPPINPLTPMIRDIADELEIPVNDDGITAAPDYAEMEAQIEVPTHQPYDMDILERVKQRYVALLDGCGV